jgi:hypothetical protein
MKIIIGILLAVITYFAFVAMWKAIIIVCFVVGILFFALGPFLTSDVKDEVNRDFDI